MLINVQCLSQVLGKISEISRAIPNYGTYISVSLFLSQTAGKLIGFFIPLPFCGNRKSLFPSRPLSHILIFRVSCSRPELCELHLGFSFPPQTAGQLFWFFCSSPILRGQNIPCHFPVPNCKKVSPAHA